MLQGIDISNYQTNVDYLQVKAAGIQATYLKATEGTGYQDKLRDIHYNGLKSQGILVGFYHFFRANKDADEQASFFVNTIKDYKVDLKYVCDVETTEGLDKNSLSNAVRIFVDKVKDLTGIDCIVYTGSYFSKQNLTAILKGTQLWLAHYTQGSPDWNKDIWDHWSGWQYSDSGKVSGLNGNIDMDYYAEDLIISGTQVVENKSNPKLNFWTNAIAKVNLDPRDRAGNPYVDLGEIYSNEKIRILDEVCDDKYYLPIVYWRDGLGRSSDKVWVNSKQSVLELITNATVVNVNSELDARYNPSPSSKRMGYCRNGERLYVHKVEENYALATYFAGDGYKTAWFTRNYISMD